MSDAASSNEPKRGSFARAKGEIVIREHVYDGIEEYDQKLPNWWLFTFYIAIVWFLAYWIFYYHANWFRSDFERLDARLAVIEERKQAELDATLATLDNETILSQWATDPAILAAGEATYMQHCTACHGADLSATMEAGGVRIPLPGLSLVDGDWKFGDEPMAIFRIVNEGSPPESDGHNGAKMQAWEQLLSPQQVAEVTAFVVAKTRELPTGD